MDSYRDHSLFLKDRSRYDFLFEYKITDYKNGQGFKKRDMLQTLIIQIY